MHPFRRTLLAATRPRFTSPLAPLTATPRAFHAAVRTMGVHNLEK